MRVGDGHAVALSARHTGKRDKRVLGDDGFERQSIPANTRR